MPVIRYVLSSWNKTLKKLLLDFLLGCVPKIGQQWEAKAGDDSCHESTCSTVPSWMLIFKASNTI
jgi:hypothetical protein